MICKPTPIQTEEVYSESSAEAELDVEGKPRLHCGVMRQPSIGPDELHNNF